MRAFDIGCLSLCAVLTACASSGPGPSRPDGGTCSVGNCLGCCQGNSCIDPPTAAACGSFGAVCAVCSPSQTCSSWGRCEAKPPGCSGCAGCCKNDLCYPGNTDAACGAGGGACADCSADSRTCNGATSTCQGSAGCSGCAGCCKNNQCSPGNTGAACGKGGVACVDCSASSKTCNAGGVCEAVASCGPASCNGCCSGGQCLGGSSDGACGKGGVGCVDCAASSKVCGSSSQACEATASCGPANCNGCCAAGGCRQGITVTECGANGAACSTCPQSFQLCTSGQCVVDPSSKWQVTAVSAVIGQSKVWDPWLIGNYQLPDAYFGMDINGCSQSHLEACGPAVDNSFTPNWNAVLKTNSGTTAILKASDLKASWCAFVGDSDGVSACTLPFETIGMCIVTVTDQELTQGSKTINACPNPNDSVNYVTALKLQFKNVP
jgi:hypothetical protein